MYNNTTNDVHSTVVCGSVVKRLPNPSMCTYTAVASYQKIPTCTTVAPPPWSQHAYDCSGALQIYVACRCRPSKFRFETFDFFSHTPDNALRYVPKNTMYASIISYYTTERKYRDTHTHSVKRRSRVRSRTSIFRFDRNSYEQSENYVTK